MVNTYAVSDKRVQQQIEYHLILGDKIDIIHDTLDPDIIIISKDLDIGNWPFTITDEDLHQFDLNNRILEYENEYYYVYK